MLNNENAGGYNMIVKMPTHCGVDTCSSCVVVGDYIFLAHHGGGQDVGWYSI